MEERIKKDYHLIMSCYHPLTGFYTGCKTEKGSDEIIVTSADKHFFPLYKAVKRVQHQINYDPGFLMVKDGEMVLYKTVAIPCGHCDGCRQDKSMDWALRCCLELKETQGASWFVTLTMDDDHLQPLSKRFIQLFLKKLRNHYGSFRYLVCAELGSKTGRPHYHAIFFGLDVSDLKPWSFSGSFQLFRSAEFEKIYGLGACLFGQVSFDSCAYVAKYATKSDSKNGCFLMMSRRPGLGSIGLRDKVKDFDGKSSLFIGDFGSRHVARFPRLFKDYYKQCDPVGYKEFADRCKIAVENSSVGFARSHDLDDLDDVPELQEEIASFRKKARGM